MAKRDLKLELKNRKYHIPYKLNYFIYRTIMGGMAIRKYNAEINIIDDINDCDGPAFLIWNHLSRIDHALICKACGKRRINILAGYNEFFRSHLHMVFKLNSILPKKNFCNDRTSIKAMTKIIRDGGVIAMSPEGQASIYGVNHPVVPGTAHFMKHFGIPVYFCEMRGAYLTCGRCNTKERLGKCQVTMKKLFTPEDLEKYSEDEINNIMNTAFRGDDYAWGRENHIEYKGDENTCEKLNELCYKCPMCGAEHMTYSKDKLVCPDCGYSVSMDSFYEFHKSVSDKLPNSPSEWVEWERMNIIKEIRKDPNFKFSLDCEFGDIPNNHFLKKKRSSEICGRGTMTFDHSGIHFSGLKRGEEFKFDLSYGTVYTFVVVDDTKSFSVYVDEEYYDFFPDENVVLKAILITEEMHRLHFNTWKNFPWNDYMYENIDE